MQQLLSSLFQSRSQSFQQPVSAAAVSAASDKSLRTVAIALLVDRALSA